MPSPSRQPDGTFSHLDPRGGSADEAARIAAFGGLVGAMKVSFFSLFGERERVVSVASEYLVMW